VVLGIFLFFANSFAFILSTVNENPKRFYNYVNGFVYMEISTLIVLALFRWKYEIMTMKSSKYIMVFSIFTVINFYICYDAYLIVLRRGSEYFENEYILAFYSL